MSLLKKHIAANPIIGTRETHYCTLLSWAPSAPADVNGELKAKISTIIADEDGEKSTYYLFRDAVYGLPNYVPKGGLPVMLTVQQVAEINPKTGEGYVNAISLGVGQ